MSKKTLIVIMVIVLLTACASPTATVVPNTITPSVSANPTSSRAASPTAVPATATPQPTPTPKPIRAWIDPTTPPTLRALVAEALTAISPGGKVIAAPAPEQADLRVGPGLASPLARWVYAVAAPFPTLADEVSWADVRRFWAGEAGALAEVSGDGKTPTLFVSAETLAVLQKLLGTPNAQAPVKVVTTTEQLVDAAWAEADRHHAWAIVPFDALVPRLKVLRVDGASVLDKGLAVEKYPLAMIIGAQGQGAEALVALLDRGGQLVTNRDPEQMTVLIMTGVTALVRATADEMEHHGILYPGDKISATLRSADLLHISNEIPFASNCPRPDRNLQALVFCSDPRYMELLRSVGADLIELTGNHFQDYGSQATLDTLEIYRKEGWPYYGGGKDLADARKALPLEKNGNHLAFIGCNPVGPEYAWATTEDPGAAPCDYDYMHGEIARLKAQGNLLVATFQYWEEYHYAPTDQQRADFQGMVDAGAIIVSGSQAHHPQAIEFYKGSFIHYGLGNLFFDQMWSLGTRQEFVDRHVIYKGQHISTELLTFMLENWSQPRPMTAQERRELLSSVFQASEPW